MKTDPIIFGKGWKDIQLGVNLFDIKEKLGDPDEKEECEWLPNGWAFDYYKDGLQVVFNSSNKIIIGIRFYHNYEISSFSNFPNFFTKENIDATSSIGKIYQVYGTPIKSVNQSVGKHYLEYLFYNNGDLWFVHITSSKLTAGNTSRKLSGVALKILTFGYDLANFSFRNL